MAERRHLVIFLRAPRLGRVKSRLAAGIGAVRALRFHRDSSAALLRRVARDRRWRTWLALTPDGAVTQPLPWPVAATRFGQGKGDLGRRMARAFRRLPPGPAVLIGADIPAIRPAHIAAAFRALGRHHAVFGPAEDGGYWLVGLRRRPFLPRDLFADVRWSSAEALADTLAGLPQRYSVGFVATLADVDDAAAYARWRAGAPSGRRLSDAPAAVASARPGCRGGGGCRAGA